MKRVLPILLSVIAVLVARDVMAGMPSVLPEDFAQVFRLNDTVTHRLQAISFFAFLFVMTTVVFWGLWNNLSRGFPNMPRLSITRAACLTLLLGSMFVVVLTMISGARELLTPGAWRKDGLTYSVPTPEAGLRPESNPALPDISATQVMP